jgi:hypothetical protein
MKMTEERKLAIIDDDRQFKMFVVEKFLLFEGRISKLEVKAGIFGFLGGLIPAAVLYLTKLYKG